MRQNNVLVVSCLLVLSSACGGEAPVAPPPETPPPAPVAAPAAPPEPAPVAPEPPKKTLAELQHASSEAALTALNAHDPQKVADIFTADAVIKAPGMPDVAGRDGIIKTHQAFFTAFPDAKFAWRRVFVKGDVVAVEHTIVGTHRGEFMGIPATGKPVGWDAVVVLWYTPDGLIREMHRYSDAGTLLVQVGAAPKGMPGRPPATLPAGPAEWVVAKGEPGDDASVAAMRAFYKAFEAGAKGVDAAVAFVGPDTTWTDYTMPGEMKGPKQAKKFFSSFGRAFSEGRVEVTTALGFGDWAVVESTFHAKHTGPLGPIPASKKDVALQGVDVAQMKDGKFVRGASYANGLDLLGQIGALPPPGAPPGAKAKTAAATPKKP